MELKDRIYTRKSVRSYTEAPVDAQTLEKIRAFGAAARLLYPDARVKMEIITKDQVQSILRWLPPQAVAIYAEENEDSLVNAGFVGQQLELYLQSLGLGVCWIGLSRLRNEQTRQDGLCYAIMLCFGYPKEEPARKGAAEFKRKTLAEIADRADDRLESARLAPSSINSQPWYFTHDGDTLHVHCTLSGFLRKKALGRMNLMDMGIALAHLYVENPDTFRFFKTEAPAVKGYQYIGSCTL